MQKMEGKNGRKTGSLAIRPKAFLLRNVNKKTLRLSVLLPFPILNFKTTRLSRHIINTSFIVD